MVTNEINVNGSIWLYLTVICYIEGHCRRQNARATAVQSTTTFPINSFRRLRMGWTAPRSCLDRSMKKTKVETISSRKITLRSMARSIPTMTTSPSKPMGHLKSVQAHRPTTDRAPRPTTIPSSNFPNMFQSNAFHWKTFTRPTLDFYPSQIRQLKFRLSLNHFRPKPWRWIQRRLVLKRAQFSVWKRQKFEIKSRRRSSGHRPVVLPIDHSRKLNHGRGRILHRRRPRQMQSQSHDQTREGWHSPPFVHKVNTNLLVKFIYLI